MAEKSNDMKTRTYSVSLAVYEQAREVAEANGTTVAAVVRAAVEAYAATAAKPKGRAKSNAGVIAKETPAARKPASTKNAVETEASA